MFQTETHLCEIAHCGKPAPSTTICPQCVADTQEWLDHITTGHLTELLMIARGQARPATHNRINSKSNDIQDALNVAVWSLWNDLANTWPNQMQHLHRNKRAAYIVDDIQDGVHAAIRLTEGEEEQAVDNKYIQKRMAQIFPMRPKDLIPYLKQNLGITISQRRVSDWKRAQKITPRFTNKEGWQFYHPAEILRAIDNDNRHDPKQYLYINATV